MKDIYDELLKWKSELLDEVKSIEKIEKERELQTYTLQRKIDILETVKRELDSNQQIKFETARIEPFKGSLESLEQEIKSKEESYSTRKKELKAIIDTLQVQIDQLYQNMESAQ
ncbi:hypothetical protein [Bacillus thuringiensis]|uniref:hypothetical protein n=1 Tax=Bacillus thuringiensis TaxID=1428 RepID=UPI000BFBD8EA|nr:hypothetical protein [Bacillus thuringiensis]PGP53354.1 hypothetical protein COA06_01180 [Bacillus thuringiensis]